MEDQEQLEFLESAVRDFMEQEKMPKRIVLAYMDEDNSVTFSYHQCNYSDLQRIGQEMINESILRLVAGNKDRIKEIEEDLEE